MTDKSRLGKGLSSLLGDKNKFSIINDESSTNYDKNKFIELSLDKIDRNPEQPRKYFNQQEIDELAESIKEYGIIQPILVQKKNNDRYQIIAGERRFIASKQLGLDTIPAIIRDNGDEERYFVESLIENIQRSDLNPIEEAEAYRLLIDKYSYTQDKLATAIGKNRSTVTNLLRLLTLPQQIQSYLIEGKISMGQARALINCPSALEIAEYAIANESTVREVEKLVKGEKMIDEKIYDKHRDDGKNEIRIAGFDKFNEVNGNKCKLAYNERTKMYSLSIKFKDIELLEQFINRNN